MRKTREDKQLAEIVDKNMTTKDKKMKMMTLDELKDRDIGKIGSPERDQYEFELKMEVLGEMMKPFRKEPKDGNDLKSY